MIKQRITDIINKEAKAVESIPVNDCYEKAIELIYSQVHQKGGKLIASGMGKAGQIALNIATTFSSTGTPSVFLHPADAQHGDLGVIQKNDILLVISNSGKTAEIIKLIELSKILNNSIKVIVISSNEESVLAKDADVFLFTGNPREVCPLGLSPTTSTTVMTVIGDILVASMIDKIEFSASEYAKRHHSGYLGYKSKNIENEKNIKK